MVTKQRKPPTPTRWPDDLHGRLRIVAIRRKITLSAAIRMATRKGLPFIEQEDAPSATTPTTQRRRVLSPGVPW